MNPNPYQPGPHDRSAPSPRSAPRPTGEQHSSPFAVHGDPTRRVEPAQAEPEPKRRHMMWIRPTDLPTQLLGSKQVLAGIDLHAALVQKLWRQPAKAVEAIRRRADHAGEQPSTDPARDPGTRISRRSNHEGVDHS